MKDFIQSQYDKLLLDERVQELVNHGRFYKEFLSTIERMFMDVTPDKLQINVYGNKINVSCVRYVTGPTDDGIRDLEEHKAVTFALEYNPDLKEKSMTVRQYSYVSYKQDVSKNLYSQTLDVFDGTQKIAHASLNVDSHYNADIPLQAAIRGTFSEYDLIDTIDRKNWIMESYGRIPSYDGIVNYTRIDHHVNPETLMTYPGSVRETVAYIPVEIERPEEMIVIPNCAYYEMVNREVTKQPSLNGIQMSEDEALRYYQERYNEAIQRSSSVKK